MSWKLHLTLLAACLLAAGVPVAPCDRVPWQDVAKQSEQFHCEKESCAIITGTIDDRNLPPRKDRPFLITLYPAPYGEPVATIAAGAGQPFTLPAQKPGSYVMYVSGYTGECWIKWKKRLKLRAGETKRVNPKPAVVANVLCE